MARQYVNIDLRSLVRFREALAADLRLSGNGPIRTALVQWAALYRGAMQERFDRFSKGGGDWPPLRPSTKARRRKARRGYRGSDRKFTILRDTGTLFAALNPVWSGKPGAIQYAIPMGVKVGYGGPSKYVKGKNPPSIADIASFHQNGGRWLPKREILVAPPEATVKQMATVMDKALDALSTSTGNK